jgi:hypothetical protein
MKISKIHHEFARLIHYNYGNTKQDVLDHTEKYLGPNWEAVINFWLYLDTLSREQIEVVRGRYYALSIKERDIAFNKAVIGTRATIKYAGAAGDATYYYSHFTYCTAVEATYELLGLEKLLEQDYKPVFFPLFLDL